MYYTAYYDSPLGKITFASDGASLVGLWLDGQKHFAAGMTECEQKPLPVFDDTARWLDEYFAGRIPSFTPKLAPRGSAFRTAVWNRLLGIPYGRTAAYGEIARDVTALTNTRPCAQAVGGAVGANPISLIIPCHRVIGASGDLTGYAGGMDKKIFLLKLEKADLTGTFYTKKLTPPACRTK